MNKEFISYEQALELKELGFDELCLAWHNSGRLFIDNYNAINSKMDFDYCCALPLYQQAFRWFREKYDLFISITHYENGYSINDLRRFETYEEAELECLKKLIETIKNNKI